MRPDRNYPAVPEGWCLVSDPLPSHQAKLAKLREVVRCRVVERAAILHEATGCTWQAADLRAFELEAVPQGSLPGVRT